MFYFHSAPRPQLYEPRVTCCVYCLIVQYLSEFYNDRGGEEKNFDVLNNDFNWSNVPFSFLNENTVFMQLTALTNIIYKYLANWLSNKVDWFKSNFRLKKFILRFITVASKWNYRGRMWKLKLFTNKNYEILFDKKKFYYF